MFWWRKKESLDPKIWLEPYANKVDSYARITYGRLEEIERSIKGIDAKVTGTRTILPPSVAPANRADPPKSPTNDGPPETVIGLLEGKGPYYASRCKVIFNHRKNGLYRTVIDLRNDEDALNFAYAMNQAHKKRNAKK